LCNSGFLNKHSADISSALHIPMKGPISGMLSRSDVFIKGNLLANGA
jgi:hypothetical protein